MLDATHAKEEPLPPQQLQGDAWPKGHSHGWPERVEAEVVYTCEGCGARYDGAAIQGEREADK